MNFEQLLYAEVLSHHTSMQKAADMLHITKSGLSMAIGQLEDELGIRLFERTQQGTRPTPEGMKMLSSISSILKDRNTLISTASELKQNSIYNTISIRYMSTMFPSFVIPYLDHYEDLFSHCRLDICMSELERITDDLRGHRIDAGFIGINTSLSPAIEGLLFRPVIQSRMVLGCSENNPLAQKDTVTAEDLREQVFCLYNEEFQEFLFDRLQFICGPLKIIMRVDDAWAMNEAIDRLNAVCIGREALGRLSRDEAMKNIHTISISNLIDDSASLGWLLNPNYGLSEPASKLIDLITEDIKNAAQR